LAWLRDGLQPPCFGPATLNALTPVNYINEYADDLKVMYMKQKTMFFEIIFLVVLNYEQL